MRVQTGITTLEISQNIDWLTASKEDRAQLYVVLRAISDLTGQTIEQQMEEAFGYKLLTGADYLRNFRRGAIAKSKAKLIAAWIEGHHSDTAHRIAPDLFPRMTNSDWSTIILQNAIRGKFRIVREKKDIGLLVRDDQDDDHPTLKLGEKFHFELDSEIDGYAVAYQGYRSEWYSLPLGTSASENVLPVTKGEQVLPRQPNNKPIELSEKEDLGTHQFAIFIAETIDQLPDAPNADISACEAHLNQVTFSLDS